MKIYLPKLEVPRITAWRVILAIILAVGLYSTAVRFYYGLGTVTHLSDGFPWGVWVGFDVFCGVALAAGGFTLACVVYIFKIEKYRPIIRPTILTAFLGYILVAVALIYDLGKPWNMVNVMVFYNPHSVMFEVAWCVILYLTVLALEFSPVVLEKFGFHRLERLVHFFIIPLVILGVILSTLHQSSLGTLFVIMPNKLHPLWYSMFLPVFFYLSAIAVGISMVIFESYLSHRFFKKSLEAGLLRNLGRVNVVIIAVYLMIRFLDLMSNDALKYIFAGTTESWLFNLEILGGFVLPMIMFASRRVRESKSGLFISALLVVLGVILNRLNVSITGMAASYTATYFPSWMEVSVSIFIVAIGFISFAIAVRFFEIFPASREESPARAAVRVEDVDIKVVTEGEVKAVQR